MTTTSKWRIGLAVAVSGAAVTLGVVMAVEVVEAALGALRGFLHLFDGAVAF